jgi:hypothetical protein
MCSRYEAEIQILTTLVEFELLMELKIKQKKGTSLHTSC